MWERNRCLSSSILNWLGQIGFWVLLISCSNVFRCCIVTITAKSRYHMMNVNTNASITLPVVVNSNEVIIWCLLPSYFEYKYCLLSQEIYMFVKVLSSVPHNHHYMIKYITFITKSQLQPKGKVKHHICPRKIWPEYKNLNENAWNVAFLTPREHFIAHLLLWKTLPQHSSMAYAALAMQHKNNEKIN